MTSVMVMVMVMHMIVIGALMMREYGHVYAYE